MKCLTWNLEWKLPTSVAGKLIQSTVATYGPDVVCYTEADLQMVPEENRIESDPDYGYSHDGKRRKVILWSKSAWEEIDSIGDKDMPTGRFVSGVTCGVRFVGVCIPWRDAHVKTGQKNREAWEDHLSFCEGLRRVLTRFSSDKTPICLLGDFNQRIPRVSQPSRVFDALVQAMPSSFRIVTQGIKDADGKDIIDHIDISDGLESVKTVIIPRHFSDGTRLSDHVGVASIITKTPA